MKKDTYYFQHDYNARSDPKMIRLLMRFGCEGVGAYWCIIEQLYEQGGSISVENFEGIAFALHIDVSKIASIVQDFDLFQNNGEIFWSNSVNERLGKQKEISDKRRAAGRKGWQKMMESSAIADSDSNKCLAPPEQMLGTPRTNACLVKENINNITTKENIPKGISKKGSRESSDSLPNRTIEFYSLLVPFVDDFGKKTIRDFFDYWSEPNKSKTKMRWELEKTWDVTRRIKRWASKDKQFNKKPNEDIKHSKQERDSDFQSHIARKLSDLGGGD